MGTNVELETAHAEGLPFFPEALGRWRSFKGLDLRHTHRTLAIQDFSWRKSIAGLQGEPRIKTPTYPGKQSNFLQHFRFKPKTVIRQSHKYLAAA
jgi:hypothetical protein